MAGVTLFWDSNFKTKALEPVFKDDVNVPSPLTLANAAVQNLRCNPNAKAIILKADPAGSASKIKIEVSKTVIPGTPVAETGAYHVDLANGDVIIPLENITYVMLTNNNGSSRDYQFQFMLAR